MDPSQRPPGAPESGQPANPSPLPAQPSPAQYPQYGEAPQAPGQYPGQPQPGQFPGQFQPQPGQFPGQFQPQPGQYPGQAPGQWQPQPQFPPQAAPFPSQPTQPPYPPQQPQYPTQPPYPSQTPQFGAPYQPPPNQAPGQYAQYPQGAYMPAPRRRAWSRGPIGAIAAIIGIVALVGIGVLGVSLANQNNGKILFSMTAPTLDGCKISNTVTTIDSGKQFHMLAVLNDQMKGTDAINITVTKDGQPFDSWDEPADGTTFDCYGTSPATAYDPLQPGTYVFTVTHNGKVEAEGTLTVR